MLQIGEPDGTVFLDERVGPVVEHLGDRDVVRDRKGEVQVGEAVAAAERERTDGGPGDDAHVVVRKAQHAVAERIPLLDGEHATGVPTRLPRRPSDARGTTPRPRPCP